MVSLRDGGVDGEIESVRCDGSVGTVISAVAGGGSRSEVGAVIVLVVGGATTRARGECAIVGLENDGGIELAEVVKGGPIVGDADVAAEIDVTGVACCCI